MRNPLNVAPTKNDTTTAAARIATTRLPCASSALTANTVPLMCVTAWYALPTATAMLRLAPALLAQGLAVPPEQALPVYIRDKVAQTTSERAALRAAPLSAPPSAA